MSRDDSETDEYEVYTRRETLKKGGAGAAAMAAYPASHSTDPEGFIASVKDKLSGDPDLVVMHDGEVVTEDPKELNFEGSAIKEVTVPNDYDDVVRITLEGGSGLWTENADGSVSPTTTDGSASVDQITINDLLVTALGGDEGYIQLGDIGDLKELRLPGETGLGGGRIVQEDLDQTYGGIPGIEMREFNTQQPAVALRPADTGTAGIWWDRADGSKEWAVKALSGSAEHDDETAPLVVPRTVNLRDGANVRNETMAPASGISRGLVKFRDDFLAALDHRWTQQGAGSVSVTGGDLESSGGGGHAVLSTGATSGNEARLDFNGVQPFPIDHAWTLRLAFRVQSDTNVVIRWGLRQDSNNYVEFVYDDSVASTTQAETASGGSVTQQDTGATFAAGAEYGCEIEHDPYAGQVNFRHSNARAEYPSYTRFSQNELASTTNIPSGYAEPYISVTTGAAADKTFKVDYYWVESERVPHTRDP